MITSRHGVCVALAVVCSVAGPARAADAQEGAAVTATVAAPATPAAVGGAPPGEAPAADPAPSPRERALLAELELEREKYRVLKEKYDHRNHGRLDLGASVGLNTGAALGVEADYRVLRPWLGAGAGLGLGLWGYRITPHVRAYPFGLDFPGVFAEVGVSLNTGRPVIFEITDAGGIQRDQRVQLRLSPSVTTALGFRLKLCDQQVLWMRLGSWVSFKAGWAFRLYRGNVENRSEYPLSQPTQDVLAAAQHEGFAVGASYGFSFY